MYLNSCTCIHGMTGRVLVGTGIRPVWCQVTFAVRALAIMELKGLSSTL